MFKRMILIAAVALLAAAPFAQAADHGYITGIPSDRPAENLFRVNINKINGRDAGSAVNKHLPVGENEVTVSLVFNSAWGNSMQYTQGQIYEQTFKITAEKGNTYFIGAKVDTSASAEAQREGTFWEPMIVETH